MDHIREELLRQRRALAALMMGGAPAEETEDGQAALGAERMEAELDAGGADAGRGRGSSSTAPGGEGASLAGAAKAPAGMAADLPETGGAGPDAAERRRERSAGGTAVRVGGRPAGESLARGRKGGTARALWNSEIAAGAFGDGDVLVSGGVGPWVAAGAAESGVSGGARALSLAFQRDARRYDGGFSLY